MFMFIDSGKTIGLNVDVTELTQTRTLKFPDVDLNKGMIITSDSVGQITYLPASDLDGKILMADSTQPTGLKWIASITGVMSFNTRTGAVTLTSGDVTTALGYTPVNKSGDAMSGLLILSADPVTSLGAATKQYVDNTPNQTITLTGDVTGSGTSSLTTTLTTVNVNVGSFGNATNAPTFVVNAKGLVTAASSVAIAFPVTSVAGKTGAVTLSLTTDVIGTLQAGQFPALTSDITTTTGSLVTTLATVNSNVGVFGDSTHVGTFTVNGKGLITAVSSTPINVPTALGYTPVNKAGDTMTGQLVLANSNGDHESAPSLAFTSHLDTGMYYRNPGNGDGDGQNFGIAFAIGGSKALSLETDPNSSQTYLALNANVATGWGDYYNNGNDNHYVTKGELQTAIPNYEFSPQPLTIVNTSDNTPTSFYNIWMNQARYHEVHIVAWTMADGPKKMFTAIVKAINQTAPTNPDVVTNISLFPGDGMSSCNVTVSGQYLMVTGFPGTQITWRGWVSSFGT